MYTNKPFYIREYLLKDILGYDDFEKVIDNLGVRFRLIDISYAACGSDIIQISTFDEAEDQLINLALALDNRFVEMLHYSVLPGSRQHNNILSDMEIEYEEELGYTRN